MKLIERYIYAVTKNLKGNKKKEVEKELKAIILDMLPDDYNKKEIKEVLENLGDPKLLAQNYSGKKNHLIKPKYFDSYLYTLKITSIIFVVLTLITSFMDVIRI